MKQYYDDSWLTTNVWGKWGADDEVGAMNMITPETVLKAATLIKEGKVYDLETERFKGMPIWPGHCGFDIISYASPKGRRNMLESNYDPSFNWSAEGGMLDPKCDDYTMGLNTEIMVAPLHLGTHIDAFCHWTTGDDDHWYNGFTADKYCTSFGPVRTDIAKIPPIVARGVLLDIAGYKGVDALPDNYIITAEDCDGCAKWEGVELKAGDCVLCRTGQVWPACKEAVSAGMSVNAAVIWWRATAPSSSATTRPPSRASTPTAAPPGRIIPSLFTTICLSSRACIFWSSCSLTSSPRIRNMSSSSSALPARSVPQRACSSARSRSCNTGIYCQAPARRARVTAPSFLCWGLDKNPVSDLRTLVFQTAAVLLLPLVLGVDGIWLAVVAAELVAAAVTTAFLIVKRKRYHYAGS